MVTPTSTFDAFSDHVQQATAEAAADPVLHNLLRRLLIESDTHANDATWTGVSSRQLGVGYATLAKLVEHGVLAITAESNSRKYYVLNDPDLIRNALAAAAGQSEPAPHPDAQATGLPADLFTVIEGMGQQKDMLRRAILAHRPVSCLLVGPPATSKSLFLSELARLPQSHYTHGYSSTRAGLLDYLFDHDCRYLIVDEIDKADGRDLAVLLGLMETGLLTSTKRRDHRQVQRTIWVFAGANNTARMTPELLSRFLRLDFAPYTREEYLRIAESVLVRREGKTPEFARSVALAMAAHSHDLRDAVRLAALTDDVIELPYLARLMVSGVNRQSRLPSNVEVKDGRDTDW